MNVLTSTRKERERAAAWFRNYAKCPRCNSADCITYMKRKPTYECQVCGETGSY